jgi:hypothetical protein
MTNTENQFFLVPTIVTEILLHAVKTKNYDGYDNIKSGDWILARAVLFGCVVTPNPIYFSDKNEAILKAAVLNKKLNLPEKTLAEIFSQATSCQN